MMVWELLTKILLIKTVRSINAKMYIYIIYYSLRYYKETQLVRLFFTKGIVELEVKILYKYIYKEFLKILS